MSDYTIATLGSHSALQILKGARDEGFKTLCICLKDREQPYRSFGVADEIIVIESYDGFFEIEKELLKKNAILIPHASLIAYLGVKNITKIQTPYFGDKEILAHEADRDKQHEWLLSAGLTLPKIFSSPEDIDRPCIIKFHGARGGDGYFIANSPGEFYEKIAGRDKGGYVIQEYIVGVPIYIHYFYSPLTSELELMGFDRRYESNADGIGRIPAKDQLGADLEVSYNVTGNTPVVLRESLLPEVFRMGEAVVKESKGLTTKGLYGAFCLETILTPQLRFVAFEISARIVAGTNLYTSGSPYTALRYTVPMSTGRRIAREIKRAIEQDTLPKVLG